jgi:hypothetical protein
MGGVRGVVVELAAGWVVLIGWGYCVTVNVAVMPSISCGVQTYL